MRVVDDQQVLGTTTQGATAYTNATTAYTDLPGAIAVPAFVDADPTRADSLTYYEVTYQATLSKATGGSATLGLFVNGAVLADSEEVVTQAGGARMVTNTILVPLTNNAAQTVKLQAKSSDTSILTVTKARLTVKRYRMPGGPGEPNTQPIQ